MMLVLGLPDPWIAAAIFLSIAITVFCAIYGIVNWNRGDDAAPDRETIDWAKDEEIIEKEL